MQTRLLILAALAAGLTSCDFGTSVEPGPAGQLWRAQIAFDPTSNQTLMFAGYPVNIQSPRASDTTSLEWSWNGLSAWSNLASSTDIPRFGIGTYSGVDKGILYFSPGVPLAFDPSGIANFPGIPKPTVWLSHGQDWKNVTTSDIPTGLNEPLSMIFDSKKNQVLLMGSTATGPPQLWSWNGANWNKLWAGTGPGPSWISAGPGGAVLGFSLNQTYSWTGFAWTQLNIAGTPQAQGGAETFTYLPAAQDVVCTAFIPGKNAMATFIYDGKTWNQISGPSPSARWFPGLGPTSDGSLILYGGMDPVTNHGLADTWTFDGKAWKQVGA